MVETLTDSDLLKKFGQCGDSAYLLQLISRYQNLLYTVALRILNNQSDVEEVLQETCMKVLSNAGSFCGDGSLKNWLLKIVINTSLMRKREQGRKRRAYEEVKQITGQAKVSESEMVEMAPLLETGIAQLDSKTQVPLILHYYEKMTQTEIAKAIGCTQVAVHKRLRKAEDKLKVFFHKHGYAAYSALIIPFLQNAGLLSIPKAYSAGMAATISTSAHSIIVGATSAAITAKSSIITGGTIMSIKAFCATTAVVATLCLSLGYMGGQYADGPGKSLGNESKVNSESSKGNSKKNLLKVGSVKELESQRDNYLARLQAKEMQFGDLKKELDLALKKSTKMENDNRNLLATIKAFEKEAENLADKDPLAGLSTKEKKQLEKTLAWLKDVAHGTYDKMSIADLYQAKSLTLYRAVFDDGVPVADYFASLPNVEKFNLAMADIKNEHLKHIPKKTSTLYLHGTKVTDEAAREIRHLAPNLKVLIAAPGWGTEKALKAIAELKQLEHLSLLFANNVTDAGLRHIANLPNLKALRLSANAKISGVGLKALNQLPLTSLDLRAKISDHDLAEMNYKDLEILSLTYTSITGSGLTNLIEGCPKLKELNLAGPKLTEGFYAFERIKSLRLLDISRTTLKKETVKIQSLLNLRSDLKIRR